MEHIGDVLKGMGGRNIDGDALSARPGPREPGPDGPGPGDPSCARCGGLGWFTVDVPVSDPRFGSAQSCECQLSRVRDAGALRLLRYSNLGPLSGLELDSLKEPIGGDPEAAALFARAKDIAAKFAEFPRGWLVLTGGHGSGKTRLAAAIANAAIGRGHVALFVHLPDLMDHLRSSFGPTSEISYTELFERVRATPLLVLDDVGGQASTPWAMEKLRQIVNHRFNSELPTVFTSAADLGSLDPYLRVRMEAPELSQVVELKGPGEGLGGEGLGVGAVPAELLERMTFDSFDPQGNGATPAQQERLQVALESARGFADLLQGWLTLQGPTGVGKTHLAVAIAAACQERGRRAFFAFVPDLLDHLRDSQNRSSPVSYRKAFNQVLNAELLILDGLAMQRSGTWPHEKLSQIIVHRHNRKLPTVITTDINFDKESGPISSRVNDKALAQVVHMDPPDFRGKGRREDRWRGPVRGKMAESQPRGE